MASSLNAEAPSFVPSQNTIISYSPNHYYQNPGRLISYSGSFYVIPDETSLSYVPPPPSSYPYYYPVDTSFEQVEVVQPFVLAPELSVSLLGCTIHDHELDENHGTGNIASNGDEPAAGALVINRQRVVAPRPVMRPLRNRARTWEPTVSGRPGLKVSHQNFEIRNEADLG